MKKFLYIIGIFLFGCCFLIACSYSMSSQIKNNISEISTTLFVGEHEEFYATLTCGQREDPYLFDGRSQEKQNFAVLTVTLFESQTLSTLPYKITIAEQIFEGELDRNTVKANYMTDLEIAVADSAEIRLIFNENEIALNCVSDGFLTNSTQAIDLAIENLNDELLEEFAGGNFNGECYLRILNNPIQNKNVFFWHFSIINSSSKVVATVIIDTMSSSILAKY